MTDHATATLASAAEKYYEELKRFLIRKVGCPSTAEDILHETWLRAASRTPSTPVQNPRAFLYRIANNLVIDRIRRDKLVSRHVVQGVLPEDTPAKEPTADSRLIHQEKLMLLQKAVDELPPRCKEVFVLRKYEMMEQAEIAERLGISRNMVEKHLRKALHHCLKRLGESE
ncbi:MAG: sigma-70 family RNA polymerase sigma factor [Nitrospina sp.]|nr:sigma-70 family RNA polymerase sigma factor [Nitrospina sp.]